MMKTFMSGCLALLSCLTACKTTPSKELHDEGRAQNDTAAYQWQVLTESEFVSNALVPRLGAVKGKPVQDPLRIRLQFWLDQLDLYLREKDPVGTKAVPKPQVFLMDHAMPNAFVPSVEMCLQRQGVMQGGTGAATASLGFDRELSAIFSLPTPGPCGRSPYSGAELQKYMDWYLQPLTNCTAKVSARSIDFAEGCLEASIYGAASPASTQDILMRATGNWIVVTSGLIRNLSEYEAVYTIFHEAAHYYMAHLSNPGSLYGYFYALGKANASQKPKPSPEVQELGKELLYWLKAKDVGTRKIAVGSSSQRYHSGLYVVARNVSQDWVALEGARGLCKDLGQYFEATAALARFPLEDLDSRGQQAYLLYEKKIDACLAGLPLNAELQAKMISFTRFVAPWSTKVLVNIPSFSSVKQLWDWLHQSMPAVIDAPKNRIVDASKRADAAGLGQYTSEQEADELAVEWLTRFGIDPNAGITGVLKLLQIEAQFPALPTSVGALSYAQCQAAYAAQFQAAVPVGDYSDPHHSSCYRAYNMYREIAAHDYSRKLGALRVAAPSPAWSTLAR